MSPRFTKTLGAIGLLVLGAAILSWVLRDHPDDVTRAEASPPTTRVRVAPAPAEPKPHRPRTPEERRFLVAWKSTGNCDDGEEAWLRHEQRQSLFSTFRTETRRNLAITADPTVSDSALELVAFTLERTRAALNHLIGWTPQSMPPAIYLYRDREQLRSVACVNGFGFGYYDGAIHLAASWNTPPAVLRQAAAHEYTHHALFSIGITMPMWLHEGLAMHVAEENWWLAETGPLQTLATHHQPFTSMISAFPHASDETFATPAYTQSVLMVELIRQRAGREGIEKLISELATGSVRTEEAFAHAVGISGPALESAWRELVLQHLAAKRGLTEVR